MPHAKSATFAKFGATEPLREIKTLGRIDKIDRISACVQQCAALKTAGSARLRETTVESEHFRSSLDRAVAAMLAAAAVVAVFAAPDSSVITTKIMSTLKELKVAAPALKFPWLEGFSMAFNVRIREMSALKGQEGTKYVILEVSCPKSTCRKWARNVKKFYFRAQVVV